MATEKGLIAVVFICFVASIIGSIVKLGLISSVLLGLAYLIGFIVYLLMRKYDPPSEAKQVKGNAGEEQTRSKRGALFEIIFVLLVGANFVVCDEEPPKTIEGGVEIPNSTKKPMKIIRIGERKKTTKEEDGTPDKD